MGDEIATRVLLIDAHVPSATWLKNVVFSAGRGYVVTPCVSLAEGLALLAGSDFDVTLVELNLPDSGGLHTLNEIRKAAPRIPIVILTRLADENIAAVAIQRGAQEYIVKDAVNYQVLSRAVRHARERKATEIALLDARAQAEAANLAKSEFLAQMSHEIRTPLTAVLGYADNIAEGAMSAVETLEAAQIIRRNASHLLEVINEILDISKIEAHKMTVERIKCSPAEIVNDVVQAAAPRARAKGLKFGVNWSPLVPASIQGDPVKIKQILLNLLSNAIKFTLHGEVDISVAVDESSDTLPTLVLRIRDTGIGMTSEQVAGLFRPYAQAADWTTRKYGGTGLGLAISRSLAQLIGGEVTVTSVHGAGTEFCVRVPTGSLEGVERVASWRSTVSTPTRSGEMPVRKLSGRILLAEDGPDNQRFIAHALRTAGAHVEIANDGAEAIDLAIEAWSNGEAFDVILMDMVMPGVDGLVATRRLRDAGYSKPIVALTAHALSETQTVCREAGCDEVATKPITRSQLVDLAAKWMLVPSTVLSFAAVN
jgi:signal transduction histidine kinase